MRPGDSSLRTGSTWLAVVTGENALDSQKMLYYFSYSRLGNKIHYLSLVGTINAVQLRVFSILLKS